MPNGGSSIGVAVADNPGGPFIDPLGQALVTKSYPNANVPWLFDPACFVDDDGQGYLYFGGGDDSGQNARVIRLNDDMTSLKDASATTIATTAFFEASFMHKHDGTYYFSYSSDFSSEHGAALEYLTSDNPMTGFTYQGKFLPNANINNGNNNHGSIIDFKGKTYAFYHARKLQQELGVNKVNNRSVAVQELTYGADDTLNSITMSTEDFTVSQLACLDGFAEVQAETLAAENGIEVEGNAGQTVRVTAISDGDWVGYSQVDFRDGATKLVLRVAAAQNSGSIDVRLDGCLTGEEGTSVGSCSVTSTGGADTYAALTCAITAPAGPHDLCLHFGDAPTFQVDSWHIE
jgi:arabinoxylan arabinofuranohydrolase